MNGLLVIDKPPGMTSRDVVNLAQRWFPRRTKIGHTGTLDPLATGVLVLCIGTATRLADTIQRLPKTYATRIRLGATSDTDDADGMITEHVATPPSRDRILTALEEFTGHVQQCPPAFSAIKVNGRRAYDLARQGAAVPLSPRTVRIDAIVIDQYDWPWLDLTITCGKGTYIRSIARDLGAALGTGGLVQTLRRTRVGPFTAADALTLPANADDALKKLLPASLPSMS